MWHSSIVHVYYSDTRCSISNITSILYLIIIDSGILLLILPHNFNRCTMLNNNIHSIGHIIQR